MRYWWYSILLGISYLGIFHLWMHVGPSFIFPSAMVTLVPLGFLFVHALKHGYFVNRWDAFVHASVLLDIFLEGALIAYHDTYGFYGCAAAFAAVIIGYRKALTRSVPVIPLKLG